ncbi:trypsin-1-like [Aricia agestis]|uniref:trypsin-1-like n=1 Tax=Aricia agestis TaxID=91739 RepID=UPI001C20B341|nr:trypsin-1-like [Aricia agestis]
MFSSWLFYLCFVLYCQGDVLGKTRAHKSHDGKIVGGYNTTIQNIPYQAYLLLQKGNEYYQCGGSIISSQYILTAAHCLTGVQKVFVRVGSTDADRGGTMVSSAIFKQHPRYNPRSSDYDVGFVRLSSKLKLDGVNTKAVQLAKMRTTIQPGTEVLVSGWGTTTENGDTSSTLMAVEVPTVSNEDCKKSYSSLTMRMFCAGVPEGGKDSCQGDSGGPAVNNDHVQLGIVSFGAGCARAGYPGVYTNVAKVRAWIKLNTGV